jgi:hypothetical protein
MCKNMAMIKQRIAVSIMDLLGDILIFTASFGTSFFNHIFHVVVLSSKEQVFWIYTRAIIARMKNKNSFRNFPVIQNPRHPMGFTHFAPESELTVTNTTFESDPLPTSFSLFNMFQKKIHWMFSWFWLAVIAGATKFGSFARNNFIADSAICSSHSFYTSIP